MESFPELHTKRLVLRKIHIDDVPSLVRHADNKKISEHILNMPYPFREPDAVFRISYVFQGFKNKTRYVLAIILKETDEFIGEISLHLDVNQKLAQLAYWVGETHWNKGIATEAIEAVLKFGFEKLGLDEIYATCNINNVASCKVMLKNKMIENSKNGNILRYGMTKQRYGEGVNQI